MNKDTLSGKRHLLALALTDGALDDYPEERRRNGRKRKVISPAYNYSNLKEVSIC